MAAGDVTQGRRVPPETKPWDFEAGDYTVRDGVAWVCLPNDDHGRSLRTWDLTEHGDGTVTLSPSILDRPADGSQGWHGFLESGVWREV